MRPLSCFGGVDLVSGVHDAFWPLIFRMLAWPLVEWKASVRGMGWDMVIRSGGEVGVMLSKLRQSGGGNIT